MKNAFVVGLGQELLKTSASFIDMAGGVDKLAGAIQSSSAAMIGMGGTLTLLLAKLTASKLEAAALSKALGAIALVPLAIGAGESIGEAINNKIHEQTFAKFNQTHAENEAASKARNDAHARQRDADNATTQAQIKNALELTRVRNTEYLKQENAAKAAQKVIDRLSGHKLNADQASKLNAARATIRRFNNTDFLKGLPADEVGKLLGRKINTPDELSRGLVDLGKRGQEIRPQIQAGQDVPTQTRETRKGLNDLLESLSSKANVRNLVGGNFGEQLKQQFDLVDQSLRSLAQDANITNEELAGFVQQAQRLNEMALQPGNSFADKIGIGPASQAQRGYQSSLELIGSAATQLKALQGLQQAPSVAPQRNELIEIESVLSKFGQASADSQAIAASWERTASAAERAAIAAQQAAASGVMMNPYVEEKALGGMIGYATGGLVKSMRYFDKGGFVARGTDTVPAMLTPGEFVVNAQSSRKFHAELVALNAGHPPVYRSEGGSVDNSVSVGDVHIHAPTTKTLGARDIAQQIRRELRRGTSTLVGT